MFSSPDIFTQMFIVENLKINERLYEVLKKKEEIK